MAWIYILELLLNRLPLSWKSQETIDSEGNKAEMQGKGRHDPCVVPRAVPIVEAMAALVLADFYLLNKTY